MTKTNGVEVVQLAMLPPEALEITVRIGVVGATDHCQWLVEARAATDGTLLAMVSKPHWLVIDLERELAAVNDEVRRMWQELVLPF